MLLKPPSQPDFKPVVNGIANVTRVKPDGV